VSALGADLDHVAVAAERQADLWPRYGGDLGGRWVGGGRSVGFASAQVRFTGGMKVEALEPCEPERNDFLRRFLDHSGPGPHHLTFKVPDIEAAIGAARAHGVDPVGIDLGDPGWKEAFLHPKAASGIVVQMAQSAGDWDEEGRSPLPEPLVAEPAILLHIAHLVADLGAARELFAGLLGGRDDEDGDSVLAWPGGGRLRLVSPEPGTAEADELGARPGRLHHLAFAVLDPGRVPSAVSAGDGRFVVPPEANHGTRLVLSEPGGPSI